MTKTQKILNILSGLFMILLGGLIITGGEKMYLVILLIVLVLLFINGVRQIIYYFTMACNMVGGRKILYNGMLSLIISLSIFAMDEMPSQVFMIYLIGMLGFSGIVDVFNAVEARRIKGRWKLKMITGIVTILFAAACFLFLNKPSVVVFIYGGTMIYNGIMKIVSAVRPNELISIL